MLLTLISKWVQANDNLQESHFFAETVSMASKVFQIISAEKFEAGSGFNIE